MPISKEKAREKARLRKAARRKLEKEGKVKKGQDVDHKKPLAKGGKNSRRNLRAVDSSKNRAEGGKVGGKKVRGAAKRKAGAKGGHKSSRKGIPNRKPKG